MGQRSSYLTALPKLTYEKHLVSLDFIKLFLVSNQDVYVQQVLHDLRYPGG